MLPRNFDDLPYDIHVIISKDLFEGVDRGCCYDEHSLLDNESLRPLLWYARRSDTQCRAVLRVMSKNLSPFHWSVTTFQQWVLTCGRQILELNLLNAPLIILPVNHKRFPELRSATIRATVDQLVHILGSPKLSNLRVIVDDYYDWRYLITTIGLSPVKKLHIRLSTEDVLSKERSKSIVSACPSLESLTINGSLVALQNACFSITGLPSIESLGIPVENLWNEQEATSHTCVSSPRRLDVEVYEIPQIRKGQKGKARITGLYQTSVVDSNGIGRLSSFPGLRCVSLTPLQDSESALIGVIPNVDELTLSWGHRQSWGIITFHKPNPNVLKRVLRSTPRLKSLRLQQCIMEGEAIEAILEMVGKTLEKFEIAILRHRESAAMRMERILRAVAKFCTTLKTLDFSKEDYRNGYFVASEEDKKRCLSALGEVTQALPMFLSDGNIRRLIEDRFLNV